MEKITTTEHGNLVGEPLADRGIFGSRRRDLYWAIRSYWGLFLAIVISSGLEGIVDRHRARVCICRGAWASCSFFSSRSWLIALVFYAVVPFAIVELNTIALTAGKSAATATGSLGLLFSLRTSQSASAFIKRSRRRSFRGTAALGLFSGALGSLGLIISVIASSFYLELEPRWRRAVHQDHCAGRL